MSAALPQHVLQLCMEIQQGRVCKQENCHQFRAKKKKRAQIDILLFHFVIFEIPFLLTSACAAFFFSFPEHFCKQEQTADNCCKHALTGRLRNIADILAAICVNTWYLTAIRILGFFRHQWVLISYTHHLLQSKQMIIIYLFTCFQGRDVSEEGGGRLKKKRGFELCLGTWTTGQHVVSAGVHDFHFFPFQ